MQTTVTVHDGVIHARRELDGDERVDDERWRRSLAPAVVTLRLLGGGSMLLPHIDLDR